MVEKLEGKLFVFDLDDTLIDNVHDYAQPILDATRLIVEELGSRAPHVTKIVNLEQEIDSRRVKEINPATGSPFLFSMNRFPGSLAKVYEHICLTAGVVPRIEIGAKLFLIGLTAFDEKRYGKNIKPGVKEVLNFIAENNGISVLLSKGDRGVQAKKIIALENAGIAAADFAEIIVVENKSSKDFAEIRKLRQHRICFSVGNSYESDIVPALEAGYKGILIPVETWEVIGKMDEILAKVDKEKCFVFGNLFEIKEKWEELA